MDELAGTENRIAVARGDYNDAVADYNRLIKRFPGNLIAGMTGFDAKEYFRPSSGAEDAPKVDFNTSPDEAGTIHPNRASWDIVL